MLDRNNREINASIRCDRKNNSFCIKRLSLQTNVYFISWNAIHIYTHFKPYWIINSVEIPNKSCVCKMCHVYYWQLPNLNRTIEYTPRLITHSLILNDQQNNRVSKSSLQYHREYIHIWVVATHLCTPASKE